MTKVTLLFLNGETREAVLARVPAIGEKIRGKDSELHRVVDVVFDAHDGQVDISLVPNLNGQ